MNEPILEPLPRRLRMRHIAPHVRRYSGRTSLDIGCDFERRFNNLLFAVRKK